MIDPSSYNISVRRGLFEGEQCFEARVAELPDVVEYADSYSEAYELALDAIEVTAHYFAEQGRDMPLPLTEEAIWLMVASRSTTPPPRFTLRRPAARRCSWRWPIASPWRRRGWAWWRTR